MKSFIFLISIVGLSAYADESSIEEVLDNRSKSADRFLDLCFNDRTSSVSQCFYSANSVYIRMVDRAATSKLLELEEAIKELQKSAK